jgi:hypothetical protein
MAVSFDLPANPAALAVGQISPEAGELTYDVDSLSCLSCLFQRSGINWP